MSQPETPADPPQRAEEPEQPASGTAVGEQQQPQLDRPQAQTAAPPGAAEQEPADPDAPVDWQADPATWLRGRAVLVVAIVSAVILVVTIVICLLQWFTPAMEPLQIPRVEKA